tara:strand:+ start:964 stop:1551 length:588 start_codon:yes stop_codon:yes gene_type:complete
MIENNIWAGNPNQYVIGADEVGRGCFAGPIVGCAVKINYKDNEHLSDVKDSKKLTAKKRENIFNIIENTDIEYVISICDNKQIDQYGIQKANNVVLSESIKKLASGDEKIYVDHFNLELLNVTSLTRGEDKSKAIALASIIAKVSRDNYMIKMSDKYPEYDFANNKGYGTLKHRQAIQKYGLTDLHRASFNLMPK